MINNIIELFDLGYKPITDSRLTDNESIFFALRGKRSDGHQFLEQVARNGTRFAVVSNTYHGPDFGIRLIRCPDPLLYMQSIANERLMKYNPFVIGITGSFGKTTTRAFIAHLLKETFRVYQPKNNQNSQIGLPLTLLEFPKRTEILVLEMAMSNKGEIARLVDIASPQFVVITSIGHAHIGSFGNEGINGIAKAKGEILLSTRLLQAFMPAEVHSFSPFTECNPRSVRIVAYSDISIPAHIPKHFAVNIALAEAVASAASVPKEVITQQRNTLPLVERRFEAKNIDGITWVNDAYNATLLTYKAGFSNLPTVAGKTYAVVGEMPEQGVHSQDLHAELAHIIPDHIEEVFCYGNATDIIVDLLRQKGKKVDMYHSHETLKNALKNRVAAGDCVYVKGGSFLQLWEIIP